jgi:conserved hypothetical protein
MKTRTKTVLNFAFIFATLAIVIYIGLSGNEISGIWNALNSITPVWLGVCLLAYGGYVLLDTLSIYQFLRSQGYKISFGYALIVSILGLYYCNITPGASGGQPMQVYYLKKRNVPIGIGSSAMTVKFFCFQLMLMLLGSLFWFFNREYVYNQIGTGNMWILVLGYIFNSLSILFVFMMALSRRLVRLFIVLFVKIGTWLHLCKDANAAVAKWEGNLATFHASVMMLTKKPINLLIQLGISAVQVIVLMMVTVALYFAFGLSGTSIVELITVALLLYISASYTPLPGASGAQEGGFALYFAGIFPEGTLIVALLLWRFFTYYLTLILGALLTVWQGFLQKKAYKE